MSKLNLNSIISWVDSHIIDYPTTSLLLFCSIFFLMVLLSPTLFLYWLFLFTFYFLYKGLYKNIFIIWGFYFFSWYLIFTALLVGYEGQVLIGGEYTGLLINYVLFKYSKFSLLESFCIETIIILDLLSCKCGFPIYIPSIFKGVLFVVKLLSGGGKGGTQAECAPETP